MAILGPDAVAATLVADVMVTPETPRAERAATVQPGIAVPAGAAIKAPATRLAPTMLPSAGRARGESREICCIDPTGQAI